MRILWVFFTSVLIVSSGWTAPASPSANNKPVLLEKLPGKATTTNAVRTITWDDLLSDAERNAPPPKYIPPARISLFAGGDDPVVTQSGSTAVNKTMDGLQVKIPGFIVPLDMEGSKVRTFFLVPYYGACIHVPPPPPNQMVYVELDKPVPSTPMYEAQWVTGKLQTQSKANEIAIATYTIKATKLETYQEMP